jgi:hypothetical protein
MLLLHIHGKCKCQNLTLAVPWVVCPLELLWSWKLDDLIMTNTTIKKKGSNVDTTRYHQIQIKSGCHA